MKDVLPRRTYSQEDIQQILHLAIARQADDKDKEFSYEQLIEIATELDISPETLKQAERDWLEQQGEMVQRQTFNTHRQGRFKRRFGNYAIVNAFLLTVDLLGGGGISWSLYILLCCGFVVGLDAWNTFQIKGEEYELAFQRWRRKHQMKKFFNTVVNKWLKTW
ncbi:MAG: 2TM domain-containing protein [Iphinoe sp. HA4291-MV1]|jgi:transposase-like protein|nr:2TM domain-containing protein [Iphinoe sp. HA4291-MV1]